jgi:hypothetical protein
MKKIIIVIFAVLALIPIARGQEKSDANVDPIEVGNLLTDIAGVYKKRFKNSTVDNEYYESEDILEIVPIGEKSAYVRIELNFFNYHSCSLSSVFEYSASRELIAYTDDVHPGPEAGCILRMNVDKQKISFTDISKNPKASCKNSHCGMRGSFLHAEFARDKKRKIRYMDRLLNGRHFKSATEDYSVDVQGRR